MKKIKYKKLCFALFSFLSFIISCDDILETDISEDSVQVISPADGVTVSGNEVVFFWEPIAGAYGYLLQVFSPSLDQAESVVLDTFVVNNRFAFPFEPGTYEWRVSGENSAYFTPYTVSSFRVRGSGNLEELSMLLTSPADEEKTNEPVVLFRWVNLEPAEFYYLELFLNEDSEEPYLFKEAGLEREVDFHNLFKSEEIEETVFWQVRAFDAAGQSIVSEKRRLYLDNIALAVPPLVKPADGHKFPDASSIRFEWDMVEKQEQLSNFNFYLYLKLASGELEPVKDYSPMVLGTDNFLTINSLPPGTYFWGIQTVDIYRNQSFLDADGKIPENSCFSFFVQ
jgi:hypothetical protein